MRNQDLAKIIYQMGVSILHLDNLERDITGKGANFLLIPIKINERNIVFIFYRRGNHERIFVFGYEGYLPSFNGDVPELLRKNKHFFLTADDVWPGKMKFGKKIETGILGFLNRAFGSDFSFESFCFDRNYVTSTTIGSNIQIWDKCDSWTCDQIENVEKYVTPTTRT